MSASTSASALMAGQVVTFLYPAANYRGACERLEPRRLAVEEVRDLTATPLDPLTFVLDPQLRRGRVLVTGIDLDKCERRSFYMESMREVAAACRDEAHAVLWIETTADWRPDVALAGPHAASLPDEYRIAGVLADHLSLVTAATVAEGANLFLRKAGSSGRWAAVFDQEWVDTHCLGEPTDPTCPPGESGL
jgi:hypothetical protein